MPVQGENVKYGSEAGIAARGQITYGDEDNTRVYIDASSGSVLAARSDTWRLFYHFGTHGEAGLSYRLDSQRDISALFSLQTGLLPWPKQRKRL